MPPTVCISVLLVISVYVVYFYGPTLRKRSPFAQQLSDARAEGALNSRRPSTANIGSRNASRRNSLIGGSRAASRRNSLVGGSRAASRRNSLNRRE